MRLKYSGTIKLNYLTPKPSKPSSTHAAGQRPGSGGTILKQVLVQFLHLSHRHYFNIEF